MVNVLEKEKNLMDSETERWEAIDKLTKLRDDLEALELVPPTVVSQSWLIEKIKASKLHIDANISRLSQ
ncbi:MAG: hypothetical protein IPP17_30370 [Bacteroidetes bacterium]|nr:hypothetical protein [Bacteroidota bacterium]